MMLCLNPHSLLGPFQPLSSLDWREGGHATTVVPVSNVEQGVRPSFSRVPGWPVPRAPDAVCWLGVYFVRRLMRHDEFVQRPCLDAHRHARRRPRRRWVLVPALRVP